MSDLLIKNCEMPTFCGDCPCLNVDYCGCIQTEHRYIEAEEYLSHRRPDWCPLAELEPVYKKDGRRYVFAMWAEVPKHYPEEGQP